MSENLYREYQPVNLDQRQVDNLLVSCSDHRFGDAFQSVAENRDIDRADRIVFPAPSQNIASGLLVPPILKLQSLHDFSIITIQDHEDCGGTDYEDAESSEEKLAVLGKKQVAAINVLQQVLPNITVVTYVVGVEEIISSNDSRILSYVSAD